MKVAKFLLVLLLVVIGVLFLALVVVWGLKLGGNWTASNNNEPRVYSQQEREEIIASLDAEPGPVYTPEEQQAVVQSLNNQELIFK